MPDTPRPAGGDKLRCEVCEQEDAIGVAAVPGIPYSAAYGRECLSRGADPYWIIRANVAMCGGLENMIEGYGNVVVFHNGQYTTIEAVLAQEPLAPEELIPNA